MRVRPLPQMLSPMVPAIVAAATSHSSSSAGRAASPRIARPAINPAVKPNSRITRHESPTGTKARTTQTVFDVIFSGKTGLSLPGGDVGFALGGQYRRNTYARLYNQESNLDIYPCPGTPLNPAATCSPQTGALGFLGTNRNGRSESDVIAAFTELQLPITDSLDLQLAARYENYGGTVGSTFDPQARAKFQVTDWLAIRGGVGTTFRGPPSQSLAGNLTSLQIIGSSFRAIDINGNPNLAPARCEESPFDAKIWFLPVSFGGELEIECNLPQGAYLVMFAGGGECSDAEPEPWYGANETELIDCVEENFDLITFQSITVDGTTTSALGDYAVQTRMVTLPEDNIFSSDETLSMTKGYFAVIAPLSRGVHHLANWTEFASIPFAGGVEYVVNVH